MAKKFIHIVNAPTGIAHYRLPQSHIDYAPIAKQIVGLERDKSRQAQLIYMWLCRNIRYDTTLTIYSADACYRAKRGVCQAYCELFVRLAACVGLRADVIVGDAKSPLSQRTERHSWLFVYTSSTQGFFLEPTWGAGALLNGAYVQNQAPESWFAVDPYWMIFNHFPDDSRWQLLPRTISRQQFLSLPVYDAELAMYGFTGEKILQRVMRGEPIPEIFPTFSRKLSMVDVPMSRCLQIGQTYTFVIRPLVKATFAIMNGSHCDRVWTQLPDGCLSMRFMPRQSGEVMLCINEDGSSRYAVVMRYTTDASAGTVLPRSPLTDAKQIAAEFTDLTQLPSADELMEQVEQKISVFVKKIQDALK